MATANSLTALMSPAMKHRASSCSNVVRSVSRRARARRAATNLRSKLGIQYMAILHFSGPVKVGEVEQQRPLQQGTQEFGAKPDRVTNAISPDLF
jgi:hypothetical protein